MDDLSRQYEGRARVARFMIMTGFWALPSAEIRDKYEIYGVPIVVLFNKGVEVKRWVLVVPESLCQSELNKLVAPPGRKTAQDTAIAKSRGGSTAPPDALPPKPAKRPEIAHAPGAIGVPLGIAPLGARY